MLGLSVCGAGKMPGRYMVEWRSYLGCLGQLRIPNGRYDLHGGPDERRGSRHFAYVVLGGELRGVDLAEIDTPDHADTCDSNAPKHRHLHGHDDVRVGYADRKPNIHFTGVVYPQLQTTPPKQPRIKRALKRGLSIHPLQHTKVNCHRPIGFPVQKNVAGRPASGEPPPHWTKSYVFQPPGGGHPSLRHPAGFPIVKPIRVPRQVLLLSPTQRLIFLP